MTDLNQSYYAENKSRKAELRKDVRSENTFLSMNEALLPTHNQLLLDVEQLPDYPIIFLFGLPRSGTTLLLQLFAKYFDVGYINNLIARFWQAPLFGVELTNQVLKQKHKTFLSTYGKTREVTAPHEFAYFWHHWFQVENLDGVDLTAIEQKTNWSELTKTLLNIAHGFKKPLAMKGIWPAYVMPKILQTLPNVFFVYIERDPEDVAISLYRARMDYYNNPSTWWSMYPPDYEQLVNQSWEKQIAGQVFQLSSFYNRQLELLPETSYVTISYEQLCQAPQQTLQMIQARILDHCSVELATTHDVPEQFTTRYSDRSFEDAEKLIQAVQSCFELKSKTL